MSNILENGVYTVQYDLDYDGIPKIHYILVNADERGKGWAKRIIYTFFRKWGGVKIQNVISPVVEYIIKNYYLCDLSVNVYTLRDVIDSDYTESLIGLNS